MPPTRSLKERIVQALLYELGGLAIAVPLYAAWFGDRPGEPLRLLAMISVAVLVWTVVFNTAFDAIEGRRTGRPASARPARLRALHAVLLETTAIAVTLPILLLEGGHSLGEALLVDAGLTLVYCAWAYVFFRAFDLARPQPYAGLTGRPADRPRSLAVGRSAPLQGDRP